jgi:egghead protein (zeste-white 4 protein)
MEARPLFPYCIEVVTDEAVALPAGSDLTAYVVPTEYTTPRGSLYKARALHYLSENSTLSDKAWVFHCDEESQVTLGLVGGIRDAVVEEELRAAQGKTPRIGQGTIVYWRSLNKHPLLTLADSLRTGDDATRFRTQFRLGALFCGMHGSFILVRADIERTVSFDVGPEGSITEDAWWAFAQAFFGREFRWVDGYLVEQSPEHWKDFAKQRRRWYSGLWKVVLYSPAPVAARAALAGFLITWVVSAIGGLYTVANLFTGLTTPVVPAVMGAFVFAWYVSSYLTGLWLSLRSMPAELLPSLPKRCVLYLLQVVLLPLYGALESAGVFYAMVKPERGFHVIKKSGEAEGLASATPAIPQPALAAK